ARIMMIFTSSRVVSKISLRDFAGSSSSSIPATLSSGRVSFKIRPLDKAMVNGFFVAMTVLYFGVFCRLQLVLIGNTLDICTDITQLFNYVFIATINVINTID